MFVGFIVGCLAGQPPDPMYCKPFISETIFATEEECLEEISTNGALYVVSIGGVPFEVQCLPLTMFDEDA